ncbi:protein of unknown function DUF6 transmembrane [Beutenbergia cavernae DSM 12333]|uniref:EamA domain-containing protein n=1 Tax=Beutenbergia cavernae (strain ATCC BAA-8 / DSM 12333 / CCUG 43141 / JCM 11478 / NBRC 16432 / NCIMB 13614 / HKI 0122) TaxID=471853 RepID=C5C5X7_BEUC1|nr:EamA family transporter [Beutenbergia cavernae]ACQ82335.1 protein of unknown function DUF6 transmembrane [Beutenbergia cavernae DSM 12333]
MDSTWRRTLATAIAPVAWGATYYVTRQTLPADYPLWGGVIRALPAGLILLLIARRLPRGAWWWRSVVLGTLNMGAFFALVYLSAQLLPSSVAATIMASAPVVMMLAAWAWLTQRPRVLSLVGAGLGIAGVAAMVLTGSTAVDPLGVASSVAAMVMSSVGFVLATRWASGHGRGDGDGGEGAGRVESVDVLPSTAWQLVAGALVLLPFAVVAEGGPPPIDGQALLGFAYLTLVATALAYLVWFSGLRRLSAGTVGLIGLLNPVTGVLLGVVAAGEVLGAQQVAGIALVLVGVLLGQPAVQRALRRRRTSGALGDQTGH